jgi:hypothetical protein
MNQIMEEYNFHALMLFYDRNKKIYAKPYLNLIL